MLYLGIFNCSFHEKQLVLHVAREKSPALIWQSAGVKNPSAETLLEGPENR
jgi:hypothetical protein